MTERELLAAEYALRLLEGEQLLEARGLLVSDPAFALEVQAWEERLSPLLDTIADEAPPVHLWSRIEQRLDQPAQAEVTVLKRQLARWRAGAAAAAIAASLLLILQLQPRSAVVPTPPPQPAKAAPLLMASLAAENGSEALVVVYRASSRELMVEPARMSSRSGRSRELWIIPVGAKPISLGVVAASGMQRRSLDPGLAQRFAAGATIAITDEPLGGSPSGNPTGDVLVAGNLRLI